ncbi:MAG: hypothetical protein QME46_09110 [Thermoanaerobacteraceae bacterium]|nr:hypothetical protein [Thermoanaerobacteraceae bacterium]
MSDKKGFAMVFVLMITSLLFILGISLLGLSLSEYRIGMAYSDIPKAQYLAESGLNIVRYAFEEKDADGEYKIKKSINTEIDTEIGKIKGKGHNTDKELVEAKINAANKVIKDFIDGIHLPTSSSGGTIVIEVTSDKITDKNEYEDIHPGKDVLKDGTDHNNYYSFTVHIKSTGKYKNITRTGTADITFDFSQTNPEDITKIITWKIE